MDRKTRDKQIWVSFKNGMKIKNIANRFGVSVGRVVLMLSNSSNQYNGNKLKRMIKQLESRD